MVGETISQYKILEKLGAGSMGNEIFQEKALEGKAIEHYDKFLNLWKEADPGIPEIIDAKKRLTALQTQ